jgi:hypothetical protein
MHESTEKKFESHSFLLESTEKKFESLLRLPILEKITPKIRPGKKKRCEPRPKSRRFL